MPHRGYIAALAAFALVLGLLQAAPARAAPVQVAQLVTGVPGDWTVGLTVTSNLTAPFLIYAVGARAGAPDIVGVPTDWAINAPLDLSPYGGSALPYDNVWQITTAYTVPPTIGPGGSLGGFALRVTTAERPGTLPWFAFALDPAGVASWTVDCINCDLYPYNPGFEGGVVPVPEPAAAGLLAAAVAGLVALRRPRRHAA